jgi:hypothetical protein
MVFSELFMSLWAPTAEVRQGLILRLLNHAGPLTYEIDEDLPGEEKFQQIVGHLAPYEKDEQVHLLADLLVFLVSDHRVWLYRTTAPQAEG